MSGVDAYGCFIALFGSSFSYNLLVFACFLERERGRAEGSMSKKVRWLGVGGTIMAGSSSVLTLPLHIET